MSDLELIEPQKHARFKAGMLAAAMIPTASAPGTVCPQGWDQSRFEAIQPSGCVNVLEYWGEFKPMLSDHERTNFPVLTGSGGDSALTRIIRLKENRSTSHPAAIAPITHGETIACIRSALSLQIKELAEVLRVQRPAIYSWINGDVEPSAANRKRMQQVFRLASEWRRRCDLPADRLVRASGTDGQSVLDLLKADEIDDADIVRRFEGLAVERMKLKAEADSKRPAASVLSGLHGFRGDEISDQQHVIDATTGKRSVPD